MNTETIGMQTLTTNLFTVSVHITRSGKGDVEVVEVFPFSFWAIVL